VGFLAGEATQGELQGELQCRTGRRMPHAKNQLDPLMCFVRTLTCDRKRERLTHGVIANTAPAERRADKTITIS